MTWTSFFNLNLKKFSKTTVEKKMVDAVPVPVTVPLPVVAPVPIVPTPSPPPSPVGLADDAEFVDFIRRGEALVRRFSHDLTDVNLDDETDDWAFKADDVSFTSPPPCIIPSSGVLPDMHDSADSDSIVTPPSCIIPSSSVLPELGHDEVDTEEQSCMVPSSSSFTATDNTTDDEQDVEADKSASPIPSSNSSSTFTESLHSLSGSPFVERPARPLPHLIINTSPKPRTLPAPVSAADFKLTRVLGSGAFGTVYTAIHRRTEDTHALKVVMKQRITYKSELALILAEQRVLKRLASLDGEDSKMFLELQASFHDEWNFYFVTPVMEGGNLLDELVKCRGGFSPRRIKTYMAELVHAVGFLHNMRIVHRDIKLENVFIDSTGHLVLGDFGLACMFGEDDESISSGTTADERAEFAADVTWGDCGTPGYMAPEICTGEEYSYPVDCWALGVLMYFMNFGDVPFGGENNRSVAMATVYQPLRFPANSVISEKSEELIEGLLAKDPVDRLTIRAAKQCAYFKDVDWSAIASRETTPEWHVPPIVLSKKQQKVLEGKGLSINSGEPFDPASVGDDDEEDGGDPYPAFSFVSERWEKVLRKKGGRKLDVLKKGLKKLVHAKKPLVKKPAFDIVTLKPEEHAVVWNVVEEDGRRRVRQQRAQEGQREWRAGGVNWDESVDVDAVGGGHANIGWITGWETRASEESFSGMGGCTDEDEEDEEDAEGYEEMLSEPSTSSSPPRSPSSPDTNDSPSPRTPHTPFPMSTFFANQSDCDFDNSMGPIKLDMANTESSGSESDKSMQASVKGWRRAMKERARAAGLTRTKAAKVREGGDRRVLNLLE
ncbi:kinase-like protein [Rickenella mellea]|uniref:Kinase-like protein n=1 Tax=Rickenella mellea TaxID=50990 RepID=A0A4Y7QGG2_9AGAM|nr:kinase-like protein [Rickenella mellea]